MFETEHKHFPHGVFWDYAIILAKSVIVSNNISAWDARNFGKARG